MARRKFAVQALTSQPLTHLIVRQKVERGIQAPSEFLFTPLGYTWMVRFHCAGNRGFLDTQCKRRLT